MAFPYNPAGFLQNLAHGFGGGYGPPGNRHLPHAYDEYFKAYSVAMLPGRERENVSYGGKIIMPASALANLTNLDLESPWTFKLRNPANAAAMTHAGVLEFIAEEGVVHLPHWMMKTLRLDEGDPIRITGAELPKGKMVKLQAQSVHFLEISDHKAVLEHALRNFSVLTQGDIIEICYNSIVFGILIMETTPGGEGISVLDTDLEVDFAPPVGYVEPERPKAAAPPTMASKLKIDLNSISPGSSRPGSSLGGGSGPGPAGVTVSKGGDQWESFKGKGQTLAGRKTQGKGISQRQVEDVAEGSKVIRTGQRRIVTNDMYESDINLPAALNLPFGHLFFGFKVADYTPHATETPETSQGQSSFLGTGNTVDGRRTRSSSALNTAQPSAPTRDWGQGQSLSSSIPAATSRNRSVVEGKQRSPSPESDGSFDYGVDDDDDVIMIDSD